MDWATYILVDFITSSSGHPARQPMKSHQAIKLHFFNGGRDVKRRTGRDFTGHVKLCRIGSANFARGKVSQSR
jgi:hypothetical protein